MAPDDGDALLKKVRAQHRSVSFITASELVNIDLEDESHRNEESELNETVRKLFYNELMMFSVCFQFSYSPEWESFVSRKFCSLEYWSTKPDLDEMVIFRPRQRN